MELRQLPARLEQLSQIAQSPVWDGDLISKTETDQLGKDGLIARIRGFSLLTPKGLVILDLVGMIKR